MIDIIPNWHPFFVHFTIVFVLILAVVQLLKWLAPNCYKQLVTPNTHHLLVALTFLSVVATVAAGFFAYNSVAHDTPSHLAMTNHKNWALVTAAIISSGAVFYVVLPKFKNWLAGSLFVAGAVLVLITGFKGGELVYRYGLGVMSLPQADADSHDHAGGHDSSEGDRDSHHQQNNPKSSPSVNLNQDSHADGKAHEH